MKKVYLFYVRKYSIIENDYLLFVLRCETEDVFHTMGEMYYRTFEKIERITFFDYSKELEDSLCKDGYKIYDWTDKYFNNKKD